MTGVFFAVALAGFVVGLIVGRRLAPTHAATALRAASNDTLKVAEYAWDNAATTAKRDGFAAFPATPWRSMTPVQRDAVSRIAEATVLVVRREAEHREKLGGVV